MPFVIPLVQSEPFHKAATTLDGVQYVFDVKWNGRQGVWHMDILTHDSRMLRAGLALVLGCLVGDEIPNPDLPPGKFMMRDTADTGVDAGLNDLGARVLLYYVPPEELA